MIYELNHVGIFVSDAAKTIDFYKRNFSAQVTFEKIIPDRVHIAYIQVSGGMMEIVCISNPPEGHKYGYNHICFMTDNIDEDYERLIKAGYISDSEPKPAASGNGRICFVLDPNGVRIELIQRDDTFRIPTITEGDVRSFDHIAVAAKDLQATETFYKDHILMEITNRAYVEAMDMTMIQLYKEHGSIEIMYNPKMNSDANVIKHMAFRVDNVDAITAKLQGQGVVFEKGYPKDAVTGLGRTAKFSGPDGELIDIIDRKDFRE